MGQSITGRITLNLVAGIVVTVLTIIGAVYWMARQHDAATAVSTRTMVVGGLAAVTKRLQATTNDYAWWEEAYDAFVRRDAEWIEANVGTGIIETEIADLLAILTPEGVITYSWVLADAEQPAAATLTPDAIASILRLADGLPADKLAARPAYLSTKDGPLLLAVSRLTPVSKAADVDPATLPLVIMALYMSEERLIEIGKSFLIEDLRFEPAEDLGVVDPNGSEPLYDINGHSPGQFAWSPPRPGHALLGSVLPPIGAALLLFCCIAAVTAYRAHSMAVALYRSEQDAVEAARTDSLTGLINRHGFNELTESNAAGPQSAGEVAIVYLDVNGFKAVNDSIGHHGGDELVKALAERFNAVLPPNSSLARIGGDEFAVLMTGKNVSDTVSGAASAMAHSMDRPFTIGGFEFHVSAALGYAVAKNSDFSPAEVLRRADVAMYQAKNSAERDPVLYHPTMETGGLEKKQMEMALRNALEVGELEVAYQPIVRASDLSIVGLEALARWQSEEMGNVSPALFVPLAEDTGLIHDIGKYVFERACRDMAGWPPIKVAVNVSPVQLRDPNFGDDLMGILRRHGLGADTFELELTEGILVKNPTIAKRKLAALKDLGFCLSLDDFGTGFSSIGYLRQFPFDKLKVDRSFVREIGLNPTANALIQALVSLGEAMDLSVVAEGIENEDQLTLLRLLRCEFIQGYYVSKPISADEITRLYVDKAQNVMSNPRRDSGRRQLAAGAAA